MKRLTKPMRPMPDDFPQYAATMGVTKLRAHYGAGLGAIYRWFEQCGIRVDTGRQRPMPDDFKSVGHTMTIGAAASRYRTGERIIMRWHREAGTMPVSQAAERALRAMPIPDDWHHQTSQLTRAELRTLYRVSEWTIDKWLKRTGCKAVPAMTYNPGQPRSNNVTPTRGRAAFAKTERVTGTDDFAADTLRRNRWVVYRCDDRGLANERGKFWRVGNTLATPEQLIARAARYEPQLVERMAE